MLMYRMDDPGPGFKMEEMKHAAVNNPEKTPIAHMKAREEQGLRPGGLGLLLTQQMVDELVYNEARNSCSRKISVGAVRSQRPWREPF